MKREVWPTYSKRQIWPSRTQTHCFCPFHIISPTGGGSWPDVSPKQVVQKVCTDVNLRVFVCKRKSHSNGQFSFDKFLTSFSYHKPSKKQ